MRSTRILAATALAALFASSSAFADTKEDFATVSKAKHSLADAVTAAEKTAGGKALDGKFETEHGVSKYEVTVVQNGKRDVVDVDPTTGQATKSKESDAGSSDQNGAQAVKQAKTGLAAAIRSAEEQGGGKALKASLERAKDNPYYEVTVASGDQTQKVRIDADTGKIATNR